jgi:hypothetical protein
MVRFRKSRRRKREFSSDGDKRTRHGRIRVLALRSLENGIDFVIASVYRSPIHR